MSTISVAFNSLEQAQAALSLAEREAHGSESTWASLKEQHLSVFTPSMEAEFWAAFLLRQPGCRGASLSICKED